MLERRDGLRNVVLPYLKVAASQVRDEPPFVIDYCARQQYLIHIRTEDVAVVFLLQSLVALLRAGCRRSRRCGLPRGGLLRRIGGENRVAVDGEAGLSLRLCEVPPRGGFCGFRSRGLGLGGRRRSGTAKRKDSRKKPPGLARRE